jgi:hypothetical protein
MTDFIGRPHEGQEGAESETFDLQSGHWMIGMGSKITDSEIATQGQFDYRRP